MMRHPDLLGAAMAVGRLGRRSAIQLQMHQDAQLRRLVAHAYQHVPYYRRLFDQHRLHPRHIRGTADLGLIPVISKSELLDAPERDRLTQGLDPAGLLTARTSGCSGEPFTIRRSWLEDKVQYVLRLRAYRSMGIHPRDLVAAVGAVKPPDSADSKMVGRALNRLGYNRKQMVDGFERPEVIAERLTALQPDVLVGLPGMLDRLTEPSLAHALRGVRPRRVVVGGEVLTPAMRSRISARFRASVLETYGSHEFPLIAFECRHSGHLHVSDGVILEVLHEGRPARLGERGEVVVTNLHAFAMPFIRYRLGDLATRGAWCMCGASFSTVGGVHGRMVDYFPLPDGRMLHPYEIVRRLVWGPNEWIRQYQLVQERRDRIVLHLAAAVPPGDDTIAAISRSVRPLLGTEVEFDVRLVGDIPLEASGKLRPSRSLVHSEYDAVTADV